MIWKMIWNSYGFIYQDIKYICFGTEHSVNMMHVYTVYKKKTPIQSYLEENRT